MPTSSVGYPDPGVLQGRLDRLPFRGPGLLVLLIGAASFFFDFADQTTLGLVATPLRESLDLELNTIAVAVAVTYAGTFVGATTGGWLADRWGRRPVLISATVLSAVLGAAPGLAVGPVSLVVLRAIAGTALGALYVVALTYMVEMSPAGRRGRLVATAFFAGAIGSVAIAWVARFLVPLGTDGWRLVFAVALLGILVLVAIAFVPESPRWLLSQGRAEDAETAMAKLEQMAQKRVGPLPAPQPAVVADPTASATGGEAPSLFGRELRVTTLLAIVIFVVLTTVTQTLSTWTPTLLDAKGFTSEDALAITSLIVLGSMVGALVAIAIGDRVSGPLIAVVTAVVGAGVGFVFGMSTSYLIVVLFGFVLWVCTGIFSPVINRLIAELFPVAVRGSGTGVAFSAGRIANVLAPFTITSALTTLGYASVSWFFLVAWLVIPIAIWILSRRSIAVARREQPTASEPASAEPSA